MTARARATAGSRRKPGPRRILGQYFTPRETAAFVLEGARPLLDGRAKRIIDPSCGDGVFLETALERRLVRRSGLYGIEVDPAALARARRLGLDGQVRLADALAGELPPRIERARRSGFDLVVGNPPFGSGRGGRHGGRGRGEGRGRGRLELRFARLFADLAREGGAGGVILPVGVFANERTRAFRDSLLDIIDPAAVVELPPATFHRAGAAARTCALFFRKRAGAASDKPRRNGRCLMARYPHGVEPEAYFDAILRALRGRAAPRVIRRGAGARRVPVRELAGERWDPGWWCSEADSVIGRARVPLAPLGDFIVHITYGAIVCRRDVSARAGSGRGGRARRGGKRGVALVGLREIRPAGLDLRRARRVREGGERDPERCRLRPGDIVLARSGAGSLLKGRLAVFDPGAPGLPRGAPATVGCFVDLVRLKGIRPGYAAMCLRSRLVRVQVERLANGVGTPNISFGEVRRLLVPRLGRRREDGLAREDAAVRALHARALSEGREAIEAAARLAKAVERLDRAALG